MLDGISDPGQVIEPNDPNWARLQTQSRKAKKTPAAWLEMKDIYGHSADASLFVEQFSAWLNMLWAQGTQAAVQHYLASGR